MDAADYAHHAATERKRALMRTIGDVARRLVQVEGARVAIELRGGGEVSGVALPDDRDLPHDVIAVVDLQDGRVEATRIHLDDVVGVKLATPVGHSSHVAPGDEVRVAREEMAFAALQAGVQDARHLLDGLEIDGVVADFPGRVIEVDGLSTEHRARIANHVFDRIEVAVPADLPVFALISDLPEEMKDEVLQVLSRIDRERLHDMANPLLPSDLSAEDRALLGRLNAAARIARDMPRFTQRWQYEKAATAAIGRRAA